MKDILYLLLAGGRGQRLMPLTANTPKPLVRFGTQGSIIDYTLYNCLISGGGDVLVLTQYLSGMIDTYINTHWITAFSNKGRKLKAISSQELGSNFYKGTADAVFQVLSSLNKVPDFVVVLAGDHVYRMDYRQMIAFHLSSNNPATVGCIQCDPSQAHHFGIPNIDDDEFITDFIEKPNNPEFFESRETLMASMGIYIFDTHVLMEYLTENQQENSHDFGHDIIPRMVKQCEVKAFHYRGDNNSIPYWRDVGDLLAYWKAQAELIESDIDLLNFSPVKDIGQISLSKRELVWKNIGANNNDIHPSIADTALIAV